MWWDLIGVQTCDTAKWKTWAHGSKWQRFCIWRERVLIGNCFRSPVGQQPTSHSHVRKTWMIPSGVKKCWSHEKYSSSSWMLVFSLLGLCVHLAKAVKETDNGCGFELRRKCPTVNDWLTWFLIMLIGQRSYVFITDRYFSSTSFFFCLDRGCNRN